VAFAGAAAEGSLSLFMMAPKKYKNKNLINAKY
jgi:hypothetical protein